MKSTNKSEFINKLKEAIKEADKINAIWDELHNALVKNRLKSAEYNQSIL